MDPEIKRQVLRRLTYGMYVVTASSGGQASASTVTWLTQVSFSPPLVAAAVRRDSRLHALIASSGALAVHVFPSEHQDWAPAFFRETEWAPGRINGHPYEPGPATGSPVLRDFPAWFEARLLDRVDRGDHSVFIAEVVEAALPDPHARPLGLAETKWSYGG
jgi:flavin reductase (DIM6/NTAB) family NADH-FMN oxidoreductase RutF